MKAEELEFHSPSVTSLGYSSAGGKVKTYNLSVPCLERICNVFSDLPTSDANSSETTVR